MPPKFITTQAEKEAHCAEVNYLRIKYAEAVEERENVQEVYSFYYRMWHETDPLGSREGGFLPDLSRRATLLNIEKARIKDDAARLVLGDDL